MQVPQKRRAGRNAAKQRRRPRASRPARGPSRLCRPAWTQGRRALLKSAPTKTPLRSVKIDSFEVIFTSTPPASLLFLFAVPQNQLWLYLTHFTSCGQTGASTARPRPGALTEPRPFGLGVFFFSFLFFFFLSVLKVPHTFWKQEKKYLEAPPCWFVM